MIWSPVETWMNACRRLNEGQFLTHILLCFTYKSKKMDAILKNTHLLRGRKQNNIPILRKN